MKKTGGPSPGKSYLKESAQMEKVFVKILREGATLPRYANGFAAGADLYACLENELTVMPGETVKVPTGIAVELPLNTVGLICARSGLAVKKGLAPANKVGVIDCDYRGEILVAIYNQSASPQSILPGERVAQMIVAPYIPAVFETRDELSATDRGEGGFGSTGRT